MASWLKSKQDAGEKIEKYRLKAWAEERRASLWDREKAGIKLKR